jgi:hypothetical protein
MPFLQDQADGRAGKSCISGCLLSGNEEFREKLIHEIVSQYEKAKEQSKK